MVKWYKEMSLHDNWASNCWCVPTAYGLLGETFSLAISVVNDTHRYAAFPSSSSLLFPLEPLFFPQILRVMHISNPHCRVKKQLTSVTTRINKRAATPSPMTAPSPRPLNNVSWKQRKETKGNPQLSKWECLQELMTGLHLYHKYLILL